jgi:hypothetical protein
VERTIGGVPCPYPAVKLRVLDRYGLPVPLPFRIDTGADCCVMPLTLARKEKIPYQETQPGIAAGLVGATARLRGRPRVVLAGKDHDWPCDFVDVPPPAPGRLPDPLLEVAVLGRAGFLDEYTFAVGNGFAIITRLGPLRRLWWWLLQTFWNWCGLVHPLDRPL